MSKQDKFISLLLAASVLAVIAVAYARSRYAAQAAQDDKANASPSKGAPADNRLSPGFMEAVGVTSALTQEQTEKLMQRGWNEKVARLSFAQYGISPDVIDALKAEGVDFQQAAEEARNQEPSFWGKPEYTAYLVSAADAVVTGEVSKIRNNEEGPYHTEVFVKVDKSLKHELTGNTIQVNLLFSGLRTNEKGERQRVRVSFEPQFKEGERVLLFLSETPRQLRSIYTQAKGRAKGNARDERLVRDFGPPDKVERKLKDETFYELHRAYKIVNDKAVLKSEALYATNTGHELDLARTEEMAQRVRAAEAKAGKKARAPRTVPEPPQ
jgi:hypothetical protein